MKKDKIAFILSSGSTIFVTFDPTTCDLVEIVTDKFLQSKFQCEQLINGMSWYHKYVKLVNSNVIYHYSFICKTSFIVLFFGS